MWRKWDLHVHTPASLVSRYGGDLEHVWAKYLRELAELPPEIAVLGINDYIFLDGYKRVREAWLADALPNIKLLLPVVELRVDKFAGTDGALRRVNYHIIFSDQVPVEAIEEQFIAGLRARYQLIPEVGAVPWEASPSRHSLTNLGEAIIASVPPAQRDKYGPPLIEGFKNFNVSLESIEKALKSHYFKDQYLSAVGKTEWASIKWQDGSIAEKKSIINNADLVFVAAESAAGAIHTRDVLRNHGVNPRLLDCSDAHDFTDSTDKDRLGQCHTWIKADPTFEGLRHVLHESEHRIYLGEKPRQLRRMEDAPTRLVNEVAFRKRAGSKLPEEWFDGATIPLNPGLVAIIGRKGSGKSALLDTIGLTGDSSRREFSSFLRRFSRTEDNKGAHFEAELRWIVGSSGWRGLDSVNSAPETVERVTYIPQHLFEDICNELQGENRGLFDRELKRVIFSHVSEQRRLDMPSADEWLRFNAREYSASRTQYRAALAELNERIAEMEAAATPEYGLRTSARVTQMEFEHEVLLAQRPAEVGRPSEDETPEAKQLADEIRTWRAKRSDVLREIELAKEGEADATARATAARRLRERVSRLTRAVESAREESAGDLHRLNLSFEQVVAVALDLEVLDAAAARAATDIEASSQQQRDDVPGSAAARLVEIERELTVLQGRLDAPHKAYQDYLERLQQWDARVKALVGDADSPGSLTYVRAEMEYLAGLPARLEEAYAERRNIARSILETLREEVGLLRELYAPIQQAIAENEIVRGNIALEFTAEVHDAGFTQSFLEFIHQGRVGTFSGREEGEKRIRNLLAESELATVEGALNFAEAVRSRLGSDHRDAKRPAVAVADQLRAAKSVTELYDFLFGFSYLEPRYGMRLAGRALEGLSPGEKGALLLVFYLLLDKADTPLLLDQPEENLDNETVFSLLVPAVKAAKDRRQLLVVTHNPNLAIACDADQVVCAARDPDGANRVTYQTGAIENPEINRRAVDVLEGTMPAFLNRGWKYHAL